MRKSISALVILAALLAALTIGYAAQATQPQQGSSGNAARGAAGAPAQAAAATGEKAGQSPHFKNIQVLKEIPADQLQPSMQFITAALGVDCNFCHVQGNFSADDKRNKKTAREMMTMTMA